MKRQDQSVTSVPEPRKATSLASVLGYLLIMNDRKWLPIKGPSDNKIAICFDALMASPMVKKPKALALGDRSDGMGAQLHGQLSILALARMHGINYAHRDITSAEHTSGPDEIAAWNAAFNFAAASDGDFSDEDRVVSMRDFVHWPFGRNKEAIVTSPHVHRAVESHANAYKAICEGLRDNVTIGKPESAFPDVPLRIAVHVRRGDVQEGENSKRFTTLGVTDQTISDLTACLERQNLPFELELHSQGTEEEFRPLLDKHAMALYLNTDPLKTMARLIQADILITAKSSFSQIAAMMSGGHVIHQKFWHNPLPGRLNAAADGALDSEDLNRLAHALKARQSRTGQL
ncbi:hypothetical protein SAMN04515647_0657 [Cohaesibacter sp. ES.047]|uniref:hypothetical protein n=1 Tax=Cohaesibacter sp. ES.047 TaxID=1798205 RepID=UPI000BB8F4BB|nr:hypothetical protein [Cohaesibacter sp. ES.047]SNY90489.1 hypothetical protein SAMN04515647_0657 [Cohaesibacter sp. ES.047]